jgi:hypothetical protein
MGKTITNHPGGATTTKFDSLEELQSWAKENVSNHETLKAIMAPLPEKKVVPVKSELGPGVANEPPVLGTEQIGA